MQKIKAVHIISSLKVGGAESVLYDIIRLLDKKRFNNYVIYFHEGPNVDKIKSLGIPVYQIRGMFFKYDPVFFIRLLKLVKKIKPHFIHSLLWSANVSGVLVAKLLRIPIVCALHSVYNSGNNAKNSNFRLLVDKFVLNYANKLVIVSHEIGNQLKKNYPYIPNNKISYIKNGLDYKYTIFQGNKYKQNKLDLGCTDDNFIIGSVARFVPVKRHNFLIESFYMAVQKFPSMRLILIGQGELEQSLRNMCFNLNIQDKVIFISSSKAYGYYSMFDCFVLSSEQEGLSIALLESMSFGIPSIITGNSYNHEVIKDGFNGYIVSKDNRLELFNVFETLYKNNNLNNKLNIRYNAIQTIINEFDINNMISSYEDLFFRLCNL